MACEWPWHAAVAYGNVTGEYFNLVCNYSGLALDNPSGSTAAGTRMVQWDVNRAPAQQWRFVPCENGAFRIQNAYSGLYLDTENQSTANMQIWYKPHGIPVRHKNGA